MPLRQDERETLHKNITSWYYEKGQGMLMTPETREMFFKVKDNLVFDPETEFEPGRQPTNFEKAVRDLEGDERAKYQGTALIRQLSLLRTRLKADLSLYGPPYDAESTGDPDSIAFLKDCGENLDRRPWKDLPSKR
jgi:hypothetical protein